MTLVSTLSTNSHSITKKGHKMLVKEYFELEVSNKPYKYQTKLNMVRCLKKLELWEMQYESLTPALCWERIDGIINQDQLGINKIYIQAKRYAENKVREKDIRNFIGAMSGDTKNGVFVTTSTFDDAAVVKAKEAHHKIILIDGIKLTELMFEFGVGVQTINTYEMKEVDEDFFEAS